MCPPKPKIPKANVSAPPPAPADEGPSKFKLNEKTMAASNVPSARKRAKSSLRINLNTPGASVGLNA